MGLRTRALLWCLALLGTAEVGVRAWEREEVTTGRLGIEDRLAVMIGSSRTMRGIDPVRVESELASRGVDDVFACNVTRYAATCIGLFQTWAENVLPFVRRHGRGVVALELRIEGFNDSYAAEGERMPRHVGGPGARSVAIDEEGPLDLLSRGRLDAACWWLLARLHLTRLPELRRELGESRLAGDDEERGHPRRPQWARGDRGYEPKRRGQPTLDADVFERRYREKVLADFAYGGRQTAALEALITSIRGIGMEPVLYLMPVTTEHHGFYPDGLWAEVLAHIRALADTYDVRFVDLDADHGLPPSAFRDTSHLLPPGAEIMSKRLAERVLAPTLGAPRSER